MIEWLMVFGVGLMAGCLLMLLFIPLVHRRAVENTKRDLTETEPLTGKCDPGRKGPVARAIRHGGAAPGDRR